MYEKKLKNEYPNEIKNLQYEVEDLRKLVFELNDSLRKHKSYTRKDSVLTLSPRFSARKFLDQNAVKFVLNI